MDGLHFLRDVSPEFATDQYGRAREHLIRELFGFSAVREFPEGAEGQADIDSGPVIFGLGPSASGFAIPAAAVMQDVATAKSLLKASAVAGLPVLGSGELYYSAMPPVGQAVILFGKTELLKAQMLKETPRLGDCGMENKWVAAKRHKGILIFAPFAPFRGQFAS